MSTRICCGVEGFVPFPRGTVGKLTYSNLPAIILNDSGLNCGGEDDMQVAVNVFRTKWEVWWTGALDFIPDDESLRRNAK